ncbi:hypothetical protein RvY_19056-1 [Ramazzottius varieornatus]|uniref:Uncharacterized protein n=1 Tax=Ramazzottius varieornatus TaxID=947166 RepID=A0A1D1W841_RAMVA|nr:hypothetical protein RvY_19056-1 [Ramazzottius varieornatus]
MSATEYGLHYPLGEKPHDIVMANYDAVEILGLYDSGNRALRFLKEAVDWATPGGAAPPDEPRCGYLGNRDKPDCRPAKDISIPVGVTLVLLILHVGYKLTMYVWRRMHNHLYSSEWQAASEPKPKRAASTSINCCYRDQDSFRLTSGLFGRRNWTLTFPTRWDGILLALRYLGPVVRSVFIS